MRDKNTHPAIRWIVYHPVMVIILVALFTIVLGAGMSLLTMDTDLTDDIPSTIPEKAFYDEVGLIFPSDDFLFVSLANENGIFSRDLVAQIKEWSDAFESIPGVKGVISITNASLIKGTKEGIEIQKALQSGIKTDEELESFKQRILSDDMTRTLISKDGNATAILVTLKQGLDAAKIPFFEITLKNAAPVNEQVMDLLNSAEGLPLYPAIEDYTYDPSVWERGEKNLTITLIPMEGINEKLLKSALKKNIADNHGSQWKVSFKNEITVTIPLKTNESIKTIRQKTESWLNQIGRILAPKNTDTPIKGIRSVLVPGNPDDEYKASVNFLTSLKQEKNKNLTILAEPLSGVDIQSLKKDIETKIRTIEHASVKLNNKQLPFYNRIKQAIKYLPQTENTRLYISGSKAVSTMISGLLISDLSMLFPIVILIIILILYLSFRTARGVFLPLTNVILAVIWAMGLMGILGQAISMATMVLPIILIAVGTAYTIHVINRYYEDLMEIRDKKEALISTLHHVSIPILLAGITTIIGFSSLALSNIFALQMFGILSAIGILFALVLALTLTPALLSLLAVPKTKTVNNHSHNLYGKALEKIGRTNVRHSKIVIAACIVLVGIAAIGIPNLTFETNTILSFKKSSEIRKSTEYLNDQFTGITVMNIIVRVPEEGGILEPEVLTRMDGLQSYLEGLREYKGKIIDTTDSNYSKGNHIVGGSQSIVTFIKGLNRAFHGDSQDFYKIPEEMNEVDVTTEIYEYLPDLGMLLEKDSETFEVLYEYEKDRDFIISNGIIELDFPDVEKRIINRETGKIRDLINGRTYVGQLVFQYENAGKPENIESFIDNVRKTARINIFIKTASSTLLGEIREKTRDYVKTHFSDNMKADQTGLSSLTLSILRLLVQTQVSSVLMALVIILVMITLISRSITRGIFSIIPLAASIIINFGIMGWFKISIDMSTATIASIAIGIGIDYTLHFMERYKAMIQTMEPDKAVIGTLKTTGQGILFNSLAVAGGFSALLFSQIRGNIFMGLLMALIMITSSGFAITLLPSLLYLIKPKFLLAKGKLKK